MPGTIEITAKKIRQEYLPQELRGHMSTEKPPVKPRVIVKPVK